MAVRQKNQINADNSDKQNGRRETSRAAVRVARGAVGRDDLGVGGGWKLPTDWIVVQQEINQKMKRFGLSNLEE
jgi:hypothetical protein